MIYDFSDRWSKHKKYFFEKDPSKIKSYYVFGKIIYLDEIGMNLSGKDKNNFVIYDYKSVNFDNLIENDCYVIEIESNNPTVPKIKRFIYNVSKKEWLI